MHSEDGGHSWEEPLLVWDGPSCNKSRVWHTGGQQFKLFHSKSGFCRLEPDHENNDCDGGSWILDPVADT